MKKKALIVGISDYGTVQPSLAAPELEIEEWRDLLVNVYQFDRRDIRLLANDRATKAAIQDRLRWLLGGAGKDDQLVFVFCGHGVQLRRRLASGELLDFLDEALLAYPVPGHELQDCGIYDDDLAQLWAEIQPHPDAKVTFVIDACHASGVDFEELRDEMPNAPLPLNFTLPVDLLNRTRAGTPKRRKFYASITKQKMAPPVVVAATEESDIAVELLIDGVRRALFSYFALLEIRKQPTLTYQALVDQITPQMASLFPQTPSVRGGTAGRLSYPFLG